MKKPLITETDPIFNLECSGNLKWNLQANSARISKKLKKLNTFWFAAPLLCALSVPVFFSGNIITINRIGSVQIIEQPSPQMEKTPEIKPKKKTEKKK